jgi:transposase
VACIYSDMTTEGHTHTELAKLRREVELLRAERQQFLEQLKQKSREIDALQHQLQQLLRRHFGRSAEKIDPKQLQLFETLLNQLAPVDHPAPEPEPAARSTTNGHGRRRIAKDLPRRTVIHDLAEEDKPCPCCGVMRHVIGRETSEQIDYVPAKVTVIEHVRLKYACRACEQNAAESGPQIVVADKPTTAIDKGLAAPGLLAHVIVSKYADHLPLHRQERILARCGINISRSTMCDWARQCAELLRPLYVRMTELLRLSKVIHTDDTPVKVQDRQLDRTRTGRFWVYLGDRKRPCTVFDYTPSRSRDGPRRFLAGWSGHLQADAFGGYDGIYAGEVGGHVTEVACWAHARRKFYDARESDPAASNQALAYIRLLYAVETEARQRANALRKERTLTTDDAGRSPGSPPCAELALSLRREKSVPRLEQFRAWMESQQASRGGHVLPKSPMGQAIAYALNQWEALCVYAADGDLAIDNNAAENALRCVAVGRNNWLFCGSDNGGETAAILFSFMVTCRRHDIDPFAYLRDVLTRLPATPINQIDQFLPDRWTPPSDNRTK